MTSSTSASWYQQAPPKPARSVGCREDPTSTPAAVSLFNERIRVSVQALSVHELSISESPASTSASVSGASELSSPGPQDKGETALSGGPGQMNLASHRG